MRARMAGFKPDDIPLITRSQIVMGEEAKRLEQQPLLRAAVEARLQNVSGYSIAKDRKERKKGQTADEMALERDGAEIVAELRKTMLHEVMTHYQQAEYVRAFGWPDEKKRDTVQPYAGVVPEAAAGLNALRLEGKLLALSSPWPKLDNKEFWQRLKVTAKS